MAKTIKLEVITPQRVVYSQEINVLVAPAIDGNIGILANHTPLITGLKTGVLQVKKDEEKLKISISKGFMEVKEQQINIVVRTAELADEIDINRAKSARKRAEERLQKKDSKIDQARAEAALERALARLKAKEYEQFD